MVVFNNYLKGCGGNVNLIFSVVPEGIIMANGKKLQGIAFTITKVILTAMSSTVRRAAPGG